ncbi:MAG: hypothetical protein H0V39_03030 [Nitrosomonas sp.]|nr:hypothetical protein [Nitrosomonas sp.]
MVRNVHKPQTVDEAKQRLRIAATRVDYLDVVRKYPLKSAGIALLSGVLLGRLKKVSLPPALLGLGAQILKRL